ncbi:MAG: hypothetical protein ACOYJF_08980 [Prevotella sp.]|jgi:hypothetical protein
MKNFYLTPIISIYSIPSLLILAGSENKYGTLKTELQYNDGQTVEEILAKKYTWNLWEDEGWDETNYEEDYP